MGILYQAKVGNGLWLTAGRPGSLYLLKQQKRLLVGLNVQTHYEAGFKD
jgi:hypothetical protein